MAINLMVAVLDRGPSDLAEMAVLLAIADSADRDTGEAWPSQRTIARRARQSDRNVRNVLDRLRAGGWLTWEARKRDNGSQASNVYSLNLEQLGEAPRGATTPPERASGLEPSHKKEPCAAKPAVRPPRRLPPVGGGAALDLAKLSKWQLTQLREGKALVIEGRSLRADDPEVAALRSALRSIEGSARPQVMLGKHGGCHVSLS